MARRWVGTVKRWSRYIGGPMDRQPVEYFKGQKIHNVPEPPVPGSVTVYDAAHKYRTTIRIHKYRLMNFWGDGGEGLSFFIHESLTQGQAENIVKERYL